MFSKGCSSANCSTIKSDTTTCRWTFGEVALNKDNPFLGRQDRTMIINAPTRALLAVTTLTIEPMMFLWSVAGGMAKVSTDQMILYKVPVSDVERIIIVILKRSSSLK